MSQFPDQPPSRAATTPINLRETVKLVGEQMLPLQVGTLEVDDSGNLRNRDDRADVACSFRYRSVAFEVSIRPHEDGAVRILATLGRLPFTAESRQNRQAVMQVLKRAGNPPRGRIALEQGNRIIFNAETNAPSPYTPVNILATITAIVLGLKPHLELLDDLGLVAQTSTPRAN